jgi:hypothetical protein
VSWLSAICLITPVMPDPKLAERLSDVLLLALPYHGTPAQRCSVRDPDLPERRIQVKMITGTIPGQLR